MEAEERTNLMLLLSARAQGAIARHVENMVVQAAMETASTPTIDGVRITTTMTYDLAHLEAMKQDLQLLGGGHVLCVRVREEER